ncbi:hypothetical protein [Nannocystis pusilla]|uniref:hypothetical protein n=1 Tax=Nannocystis pusilla TaxID=889268 RepID=UPI003B7AC445
MGQAIGPAGPGALPRIDYGMFETKPYDVRLDDAMAWIARHRDTEPGLQAALRNWRRYTPEDDQRYLSHWMSQSGLDRRFADDRETARAIILMAALEHPNDRARWRQAARDVEAGRLDLYTARQRVRQAYDARHNTQQNLEAARDSLRTDPIRFLSDYPLVIASTPGREGHPYRLVMVGGPTG